MKTLMSLSALLLIVTVGLMVYSQMSRLEQARAALAENRPAPAETLLADLRAEPLLFVPPQQIQALQDQAMQRRLSIAVELCGQAQHQRAALQAFDGLLQGQAQASPALRAAAVREQGFCRLGYADAQGAAAPQAGLALARQVWQDAQDDPVLRGASADRIAGFAKARLDGLADQGCWFESLRFLAGLRDTVQDDADLRQITMGLETLLADRAFGSPIVPSELRLLQTVNTAQGLATLRLRNDLTKPAEFVLRGPTEQRLEIQPHKQKELNLLGGGYLLALKPQGAVHAVLDDFEFVPGLDYEYRLVSGAGRKTGIVVRGVKKAAVVVAPKFVDLVRFD